MNPLPFRNGSSMRIIALFARLFPSSNNEIIADKSQNSSIAFYVAEVCCCRRWVLIKKCSLQFGIHELLLSFINSIFYRSSSSWWKVELKSKRKSNCDENFSVIKNLHWCNSNPAFSLGPVLHSRSARHKTVVKLLFNPMHPSTDVNP